jgi:ATP synthase protein I
VSCEDIAPGRALVIDDRCSPLERLSMQPNDARILRGAALVTAVVGVLAVLVGALVGGIDGALGVALGVLVAGGFFGSGQVVLARVALRWPEVVFGAAVLVYVTQIAVLLGLLLLLRDVSFLDGRAFASGVLAGMVAWLGGQIWANLTGRTTYVVPEQAPAAAAQPGDQV